MPSDAEAGLSSLASRVYGELLRVRKTREGWTVTTAGLYPTICSVLGGGDPHVAFSALRIAVLSLIDSPGIVAAAASLGLTTDLPTHTDRLNDAAIDLGLGERQVRRMSDLGLIALARFVATNWNQAAVPVLSATVVRTGDDTAELGIGTRRMIEIEMSDPIVTVGECALPISVATRIIDQEVVQRLTQPMNLIHHRLEVGIQWRGELWPRLRVTFVGAWSQASATTLGNRTALAVAVPAMP